MDLNWPVITWIAFNGLTLMHSISRRPEGDVSRIGFLLALGFLLLTTALLHTGSLMGFLIVEVSLWIFVSIVGVLIQSVAPPGEPSKATVLITSATVRFLIALGVWLWMQ